MNSKKIIVFFGLIVAVLFTAQIISAQEATVAPVDSELITSDQSSSSQKETDMQWAWGEIINLDNQAKTITLKYLDYETDQEKELILVVDQATTFENIKDLDELKLKDTLSIDYMIAADNKNVAKNISFEKPEASAPVVEVAESVVATTTQAVSETLPAVTPVEVEVPVSEAMQPIVEQTETSAVPEVVEPTTVQPEPKSDSY